MSVAESDVDTVPTQAILPLSQEWVAVGSNEGDAGAEASEPVARRRRLCVKQPRPAAFVAPVVPSGACAALPEVYPAVDFDGAMYGRFYGYLRRWRDRRRQESGEGPPASAAAKDPSFLRTLDAAARVLVVREWSAGDKKAPTDVKAWAVSWYTQQAESVDGHSDWFNGKEILCTYNGEWALFTLAEVGGQWLEIDALCSVLKDHPRVQALCEELSTHIQKWGKWLSFDVVVWSWELSVTSYKEAKLAAQSRSPVAALPEDCLDGSQTAPPTGTQSGSWVV